MKTKVINLLLLALIQFCIGCKHGDSPESQNSLAQLAPDKLDAQLDKGTKANGFANEAAVCSMMEVNSSAVMIKKTENPDVQSLAVIVFRDHLAGGNKLERLAKQQKLYLPQTLPPNKIALLQKLEELEEDEQNLYYAKLMVKEHEQTLRLFETAANGEADTLLRQFAQQQLPLLRGHLAEARHVAHLMQLIYPDKGDFSLKEGKKELSR